jgi:hypothetical protein
MIRRFASALLVILVLASIPHTKQNVCVSQMRSSSQLFQESMALAPDFQSASLCRLLDSAYAFRSTATRGAFFSRWFNESSTLRDAPSTSDPLTEAIHAIFVDFYQPDTVKLASVLNELRNDTTRAKQPDKELIGFVEMTTGSPGDAEYIVIQSSILYRFRSSFDTTDLCELSPYGDDGWAPEDSVNFYPQIASHGRKVLYLTEKYSRAMEAFVDGSPPDPYIASRSGAFDGVRDRVEFLRPQISISGLHWGGWQYLTYPVVYQIGFSIDTTQAMVWYRGSWCTGAEACYTKFGGKWTRQKDVGEWIE